MICVVGHGLLDGPVDVALVVCLRRADENRHLARRSPAPAERCRVPCCWVPAPSATTSSGTSMPRSTSTPSDSCGMTSGRTKLATSMRFRPVRPSCVDQLDLVGGGDGFGFVLEPVARADFADLRRAHGSVTGGSLPGRVGLETPGRRSRPCVWPVRRCCSRAGVRRRIR